MQALPFGMGGPWDLPCRTRTSPTLVRRLGPEASARGPLDAQRRRVPAREAQGPHDWLCEHGFHLFPDLGRLASLEALRAGSGDLTTYTTTPLELYCHRLPAEV
jgi:hypothetical protein